MGILGHPTSFRRMMGMSKYVFQRLVTALRGAGLHATRYVSLEEQLGVFLRIAVTGLGNREMQERFQRSGETISKWVFNLHYILWELIPASKLFSPYTQHHCRRIFVHCYVYLPHNVIPPEIRNNSRFYPYFQHCRGAVDGSLLDAFVAEIDLSRYHSRKGRISQNLLAACTFDMLFCHILGGWEGSAADGRVWENARSKNFTIPPERYYLGDAGFPLCNTLLVPYRGVRYHLREWKQSNQRFIFNDHLIFINIWL